MAPVRRYLRITKYSVLECRIYLENPSLAQSWLLHPRYNILSKVMESIRPLVLPKLLEEKERERSKKKSTKKSSVKDVIVQDEFEVSIFLTETSTRHSLLTKQKHFREKLPGMMHSNSSRLINETNSQPVDVDADEFAPIRLEEDDNEESGITMDNIPLASKFDSMANSEARKPSTTEMDQNIEFGTSVEPINVDDEHALSSHHLLGRELGNDSDEDNIQEEDKKKLAMDISYEGFAIYGRVLCLVVKRRGTGKASQASASQSGQAKMENWITSTQIPIGEDEF